MADFVEFKSETKQIKFFKIGGYKFSTIEVFHLFIALIAIVLTLFVFNNKNLISLNFIFSIEFLKVLFIYLLAVGTGFLFHELGHKFVAQNYGFISEFRADFQMLGIMFILALFSPLILLAPGAVMILGRPTVRQNGIISVAGPLVNLALCVIFSLVLFIFKPLGLLGLALNVGVSVNAFLGIFNMLPIWVLDGKKVWAWNKLVYFVVMGALIAFFLFG